MPHGGRQGVSLRRLVADRKPAEPVFSIPADIIRRFKVDCKRAGIALNDDRGHRIDIHALRLSFIDGLVKAGVHPRMVQVLARHSNIRIAMNHYTNVRSHDLHAALATAAPPVAPTVAPTVVNLAQRRSMAVNVPAEAGDDEDSPKVLDLQGKGRVS
jgi:hypothetical protein